MGQGMAEFVPFWEIERESIFPDITLLFAVNFLIYGSGKMRRRLQSIAA